MEAIKRTQHNIYEVFYFLTDRFPGLFALLITLMIIAGLMFSNLKLYFHRVF